MRQIASVIVFLIAPLLVAQQWRKFDGPAAGTFTGMIVSPSDPSLMFALDGWAYALYRSTDGGDSWKMVEEPFQRTHALMYGVAFDGADPATVYATTSSERYRSTDRGVTWTKGAYFSLTTTVFVSHPTRAGTLYAGGYGSLRRTTTGGMTAAAWDTVLRGGNVMNISFNPMHPDTMFAGTSVGPYRSLDAGASWNIWPAAFAGHSIGDLHADNQDPLRYYLTAGDTVEYSVDGGGTWSIAARRISGGKIEQAPGDPARLYILGSYWLYRSLDRGRTWTMIDSLFAQRRSFVFNPNDSRVIFSSAWEDVPQKSTDGGTTWFVNANGLTAATVTDIIIATESIWYLNAHNRVFKTTDAGVSWIACANNDDANVPSGGRFYSLAVDPANPDVLYCGNNVMIFKSTDGGMHWSPQSTAYSYGPIYSITFDPTNSNTVYFGGMGTLRYTNDAGATVHSLQGNGLPASATGNLWAVSPMNHNRMIVAGSSGALYVTSDGGETWTQASVGTDVTSLHFHPDSERVAYATAAGVIRTSDGGLTWSAVAGPSSPSDVLIERDHPGTLFAAVSGYDQVRKTTDGGATWDTVAAVGMGTAAARVLAMTPVSKRLITGGYGGLYWFDPTPLAVRATSGPAAIVLAQNAPNPASTSTSIRFVLDRRGAVELRLFNALGRVVAEPLRATLDGGAHAATVDATRLPAGAYTYRLAVNGTVVSRRMIIAR